MLRDLRFAARALLKSRGFAMVTILTVAIAIGANSSIFTLLDVLLLRKLPVRDPDQLVQISLLSANGDRTGLSLPLVEEISRRQQMFSSVLAYVGGGGLAVQTSAGFRVANVWAVDGNFHRQLGQTASRGRLLTSQDANVAVLGYRFWLQQFAGDAGALGRNITVEGVPFTIIGVTRPGFGGLGLGEDPEVTIPLEGLALALRDASGRPLDLRSRQLQLSVAARLDERATIAQAAAHLESLRLELLPQVVPEGLSSVQREEFLTRRFEVRSAATGIETFLRTRFTQPLLILLGVAGGILVIACVHLAGLMLARTAARGREIAVMLALGATRRRIMRQILIEGLLLSFGGAAVGLLFARWTSELLSNFMTARYAVPPRFDFSPGWLVLEATAGLAIATGAIFSVVPVWLITRGDPTAAVRAPRHDPSGGIGPSGSILMVAQIALSIAVMALALLLTRSVDRARSTDSGFRRNGVFLTGLRPVAGGYQRFDPNVYYRDLIDRVKQVPGVRAASVSKERPANFAPPRDTVWPIAPGKGEHDAISVARILTSPGIFDVLSIPIGGGRDFQWSDDDRSSRVVILSRNLALQLFGTVDCVGQRIHVGSDPASQHAEVIGIVGDARMFDVRQPPPFIVYVPVMQRPAIFVQPMLAVRADVQVATAQAGVAGAVDALGREYVTRIETMEQVVDGGLVAERLSARLSGFLAAVALALSAIGLFGLMSYITTQRTREIGIRLALGADPRHLTRAVVKESVMLVALGIAIGIPLAVASGRAIASVLIGVSPWDPMTLAAASITVLVVGAAASYGPARRAARVDPIESLRCE